MITPIIEESGIFVKRDDLYEVAGVRGGKVRTCFELAKQATIGLSTAGSRSSPQVNIVANIARHLGLRCVAHTPQGKLNEELILAQKAGAEIHQHRAGYNSVIVARSREWVAAQGAGWVDIPFGMECEEAVRQTMRQVVNIPEGVKRIIMPVGSGMSLAGVLWGLRMLKLETLRSIPVLGIVVGASPLKRLERYAPAGWQDECVLLPAGLPYDQYIGAQVAGVVLDPVYEAKCARFLEKGDMLWVVGIRQSFINNSVTK